MSTSELAEVSDSQVLFPSSSSSPRCCPNPSRTDKAPKEILHNHPSPRQLFQQSCSLACSPSSFACAMRSTRTLTALTLCTYSVSLFFFHPFHARRWWLEDIPFTVTWIHPPSPSASKGVFAFDAGAIERNVVAHKLQRVGLYPEQRGWNGQTRKICIAVTGRSKRTTRWKGEAVEVAGGDDGPKCR